MVFYLCRNQQLSYRITPGDEVEDLFILLQEVKQQIPSVTAVSSGAIASDYQRLRVESICARLGLVSLAYLWKEDQAFLLDEMVIYKLMSLFYCLWQIAFIPIYLLLQNGLTCLCLQIRRGIVAVIIKVKFSISYFWFLLFMFFVDIHLYKPSAYS